MIESNISTQLQELLSKYDINDRDFIKMLDLIRQNQLQMLEELEKKNTIYHYQRNVGEGFYHAIPLSAIEEMKRKVNNDRA